MSVYHEILNVSEHASLKEIKKAYRTLARKYHPDMNPASDAAEQFIKVTEAYEILIGERRYSRPGAAQKTARTFEDLARERAKEYARMRYEEFLKRSNAYETTPMHKILWPKWVNFVFIAIAMFFILDSLLPKTQILCVVENVNNTHVEAGGHAFSILQIHATDRNKSDLVELRVTPWVGYVASYRFAEGSESDFFHSPNSETEYIAGMYILLVLAIITIVDDTKKFENKLLIKIGMCIVFAAYALVFLMFQLG